MVSALRSLQLSEVHEQNAVRQTLQVAICTLKRGGGYWDRDEQNAWHTFLCQYPFGITWIVLQMYARPWPGAIHMISFKPHNSCISEEKLLPAICRGGNGEREITCLTLHNCCLRSLETGPDTRNHEQAIYLKKKMLPGETCKVVGVAGQERGRRQRGWDFRKSSESVSLSLSSTATPGCKLPLSLPWQEMEFILPQP